MSQAKIGITTPLEMAGRSELSSLLRPQPRHRPPANIVTAEAVWEGDCVHRRIRLLLRLQHILASGGHTQDAATCTNNNNPHGQGG